MVAPLHPSWFAGLSSIVSLGHWLPGTASELSELFPEGMDTG